MSEDTKERDDTHYVFGKLSPTDTQFPCFVVVTPTSDGWRTRSTDRAYNHDYICYETFSEIMEWMDLELHRPFIAIDRHEALRLLVNEDDSAHRLGFLYPGDVRPGSVEEAEIVLRHLERAW